MDLREIVVFPGGSFLVCDMSRPNLNSVVFLVVKVECSAKRN